MMARHAPPAGYQGPGWYVMDQGAVRLAGEVIVEPEPVFVDQRDPRWGDGWYRVSRSEAERAERGLMSVAPGTFAGYVLHKMRDL